MRFNIVVSCLLFPAALLSAQSGVVEFYVSPSGDDAGQGSRSMPFATLRQARDAVRKVAKKPGLRISVFVRAGKHYLDETLVLSGMDGGLPGWPVTYTACPGEYPVLSGGRRIGGWERHEGNIFRAPLPAAREGRWRFRQLFLDGERQIRARTPDFMPGDPLHGGWAFMAGPVAGKESTAFRCRAGTFRRHWSKPTQGEVFAVHHWGCTSRLPILAVEEEAGIFHLAGSTRDGTLAHPGLHPEPLVPPVASWWEMSCPFYPGHRFYVENLLEELDRPGEWALDTEAGQVFFWPPAGTLEGAEVVAPALDCLIDLRGASHVRVAGLAFTETADGGDNFLHPGGHGYGPMFPLRDAGHCGDAMHLEEADHCLIEGNRFQAVGGNAIYLEGRNTRNELRNNRIIRAGACGIALLGSKGKHPLFNKIVDNHIQGSGVFNKYCAGIFLGMSEANFVGHNLIENTPHHAINLGSNGYGRNFVEYNMIRFACQETRDTGAINSWMEGDGNELVRDAERSGHIIRFNSIVDTPGERSERGLERLLGDMFTAGIYLDNYSSNCIIHGNIIVRAATVGIAVHSGKNNLIENNILVDNGLQVRIREGFSPFGPGFLANHRIERNIFFFNDPIPPFRYKKHQYDRPGAFLFCIGEWTDRVLAESDFNLFYHPSGGYAIVAADDPGGPAASLEQWRAMGHEANSVVADPRFLAPAQDDYRLRPDSPAIKLGFQAVDTGRIGIRRDPGR